MASASTGKIILSLTDTETLAMTAGDYVWDLLEDASGTRLRKAEGTVTVANTVSVV